MRLQAARFGGRLFSVVARFGGSFLGFDARLESLLGLDARLESIFGLDARLESIFGLDRRGFGGLFFDARLGEEFFAGVCHVGIDWRRLCERRENVLHRGDGIARDHVG